MIKNKGIKLAVIGLGYFGLPLVLEFSKKRAVTGFDLNKKRIFPSIFNNLYGQKKVKINLAIYINTKN